MPPLRVRRAIIPTSGFFVKELHQPRGAILPTPHIGQDIITHPTHLVKGLINLFVRSVLLGASCSLLPPLNRREILTHSAHLVKELVDLPGNLLALHIVPLNRREILTHSTHLVKELVDLPGNLLALHTIPLNRREIVTDFRRVSSRREIFPTHMNYCIIPVAD
jgi:hypothetical protein